MADNVQPDAGEQREESSSGLLLSVDPLQDVVNYKLAADDDGDEGVVDDSDGDTDDGDGTGGDDSDSDNDNDGNPVLVVEGANNTDDSNDSDNDTTDDSDGDASDND